MRRLIAIFLLMLLPIQAIWAAAEPYCQHEQGQGTHHVGHHVHEHHDDGASHGSGGKDSSKASPLLDHDHHCGSSLSLLPSVWSVPDAVPSSELVAAPLARYEQLQVSRIERPQWPTSLRV